MDYGTFQYVSDGSSQFQVFTDVLLTSPRLGSVRLFPTCELPRGSTCPNSNSSSSERNHGGVFNPFIDSNPRTPGFLNSVSLPDGRNYESRSLGRSKSNLKIYSSPPKSQSTVVDFEGAFHLDNVIERPNFVGNVYGGDFGGDLGHSRVGVLPDANNGIIGSAAFTGLSGIGFSGIGAFPGSFSGILPSLIGKAKLLNESINLVPQENVWRDTEELSNMRNLGNILNDTMERHSESEESISLEFASLASRNPSTNQSCIVTRGAGSVAHTTNSSVVTPSPKLLGVFGDDRLGSNHLVQIKCTEKKSQNMQQSKKVTARLSNKGKRIYKTHEKANKKRNTKKILNTSRVAKPQSNQKNSRIIKLNKNVSSSGVASALLVEPKHQLKAESPIPSTVVNHQYSTEESGSEGEYKPTRSTRNRKRSGAKRWTRRDATQEEQALAQEKKRRLGPRSKTGCWTCRVRHKSCPENRDVCDQCKRLNLQCDYSVERPQYMTDPNLQSTKLKEIREITNQQKKINFLRRKVKVNDGGSLG